MQFKSLGDWNPIDTMVSRSGLSKSSKFPPKSGILRKNNKIRVINFQGKRRKLHFLIVFLAYILIGLLNLKCIYSFDIELNFACNGYQLCILLRRPTLIKMNIL